MVITMAKLRMEHASTHGARKPSGPKKKEKRKKKNKVAHASTPGPKSIMDIKI